MSVIQPKFAAKVQSKERLFSTLRSAGRAKTCMAGDHLFEQADDCNGLYLLESGLVGLRKLNEDGTTMLVNLARPGDFIGYGPLLTDGEHATSAEILQASQVIFIDLARVQRLLQETPELLSLLLQQATRDLYALEDKYLQMATRQAHVRLAALLLSFKTTAPGCTERADCKFELPLMNKDIADLIGIRPETLSRAIGQLRSAGLAELRDHMVHIPSIAKLARLGGGAHPTAVAA